MLSCSGNDSFFDDKDSRLCFGNVAFLSGQEKLILTLVFTIRWSDISGMFRAVLSKMYWRLEGFRVMRKSIWFLVLPSGDVHV